MGRARPRKFHHAALALESLESRQYLSAVAALAPPLAGDAPAQATIKKYRIDALDAGAQIVTYGHSYINTSFADAQAFFNKFHNRFNIPNPTPPPTPPTPPAPNPPAPNPPAPPAPTPPASPITIAQSAEGNLTRLTITGTSGNDSILVSQSGGTLTITGNGVTSTVSGNFAELAIYGLAGDDTITVQSSVNVSTLLYGGAGNNTLTAGAMAKNYIVSLGAGTDVLTGNGINTSFWADTIDTVNASAAETANGNVHRVAGFYQPFSTTPGTTGYISTSLNGQNLPDPTDSGSETRLNNSLWGTGPTMTDINQGSVGDCYFLATLQSLAFKAPGKLEEMAADLGDGTYAVQFKRGGTTTYVRVDGDLPAGYWNGLAYAHPTSGGPIWAEIMEKSYAFFRSAANTYASLNSGWTGTVFSDLGIANTTYNTNGSPTALFSQLTTAVNNGKAVTGITNTSIVEGASVIGSHAYTVVSTAVVSGVQMITLRNPWGTDGIGNDGNTSDGLVQVTLTQFIANFSAGSIQI